MPGTDGPGTESLARQYQPALVSTGQCIPGSGTLMRPEFLPQPVPDSGTGQRVGRYRTSRRRRVGSRAVGG
eukprot:574442-Rhodomonas_salina.4